MAGHKEPKRLDTRLVHGGSHPERFDGAVNPPVYRVSTVVSSTVEEMRHRAKHPPGVLAYGRAGTPTHCALQEAIADLEGYKHCLALPSGLAGICVTVLGLCSAGDHVLVADNVCGPIRLVCCDQMAAWRMEAELYDPSIGEDIADLIKPNTKLVIVESPGSLTFEVTYVPAIARAAHALEVFLRGFSWGGYESLVMSTGSSIKCSASTWSAKGPTIRLHVGLEDPIDLIADLDQAMAAMTSASVEC